MLADGWLSSLAFWGVWLVLPILIDGSIACAYLTVCLLGRAKRLPIRPVSVAPTGRWPRVTLLIPVYNSEANLAGCIESIKAQSYPQELLTILAIDNGSRDHSFRVFCEEQQAEWEGSLHWLSTFHQGKTWALNTGIHYSHDSYIVNLDSDVTLHPDAISNMVAAFESDPDLIAATGAVEIEPAPKGRGFMRVLHECEFQEYYYSFNVGRRFQAESGALFTLAGAFSAFRREYLLRTFLYDGSTVGEDTYMTFELHERFPDKRVGVVTAAVCYTEPIPSLRALYSQRARWQRGEIEVIAAHPKLRSRGVLHRGFSPARTLAIDHTLAFPRIVWTFLMPALAFWGYHWTTIAGATAALYLAYVLVEVATWATNAMLVVLPSSRRVWRGWWTIPIMPAYRWLVFWMRFAGVLTVLTEAHQWRTADPVTASQHELVRLVHLVGRPGQRAKKAA